MTTGRQIFVSKKLVAKHGVKGRVASRYVRAGYSVTVNPPLEGVDFTASKHGVRYAGIILWEKKAYGVEVVERAHRVGEKYRVKPVIILYGSGPRLSEDAMAVAREKGIIIRRVRR